MNADNLKFEISDSAFYPRSSAFICGSNLLSQLDIVPERITEVEPLVARDLRLLLDRQASGLDLLPPGGDVVHLVRHVRPRRLAVHVLFRPEVQLEPAGVKPEPRAFEHPLSRNLLHSHEVEIELPRRCQCTCGDVHLDVIDAEDSHLTFPYFGSLLAPCCATVLHALR